MKNTIAELLHFVRFTHDIRRVKRAMWVQDEEVYENDSEHGYQLAMVALYVIETHQLDLDIYRVMCMCIVHDILEVHAGDTPVYGDADALTSKHAREDAARQQLRQDWPGMHTMHSLINECEAKQTDESKFVYALDKLVPMLNNYLDGGRNWHRQGVDMPHLLAVKKGKIDVDPTVNEYYIQTLELLRQNPEILKP